MTKGFDFSTFKVGCSSIHLIMSDASKAITDTQLEEIEKHKTRNKPTPNQIAEYERLVAKRDNTTNFLALNCKQMLMEVYTQWKYGRRYTMRTPKSEGVPQMMKGILSQNNSIGLLSAVTGSKYYKFKGLFKGVVENDWLTGKLDLMDAPTIEEMSRVDEIKTCYDLPDFMKLFVDPKVDPKHLLQTQGYMSITGKDTSVLSHCLVDFPESKIAEQKQIMFDESCPDGEETPFFLEKWLLAEASMRFTDIKPKERVLSFKIDRNNETISKIHNRVELCREWIREFAKLHSESAKKEFINAT